jgi:hypothetical protein
MSIEKSVEITEEEFDRIMISKTKKLGTTESFKALCYLEEKNVMKDRYNLKFYKTDVWAYYKKCQ